MPTIIPPKTVDEFSQKYYYKTELVEICSQKVELEKRINYVFHLTQTSSVYQPCPFFS